MLNKFFRILLLGVFLFLCSSLTKALSTASAEEWVFASTKEEERINRGESMTFEFPAIDTAKKRVVLEIKSRIDSISFRSGHMFFMRLALNNKPIKVAIDRLTSRLLNKPMSFPWYGGKYLRWYHAIDDAWTVVYAPDFIVANKNPHYQGQAYTYVLDITDLVNTLESNKLTITHANPRFSAELEGDLFTIVIGLLEIRTEAINPGEKIKEKTNNLGATNDLKTTCLPYEFALLQGGGFRIIFNQTEHNFESRFSFPHAGWNKLVAKEVKDKTGEPAWNVKVRKISPNLYEVIASGKYYEIRRKIKLLSHRIDIADTIINLNKNEKLGMKIRNQINFGTKQIPIIYLGGDKDPGLITKSSPPNPTLFVPFQDHGIGITVNDDVYQLQGIIYVDIKENAAGIRTDTFGLGEGKSYTLYWSVYLVEYACYFNFINQVRRDWQVNFTVDGPHEFFAPHWLDNRTVDCLREELGRLGPRYMIAHGGWVNVDCQMDKPYVAFGVGGFSPMMEPYRKSLKEAIKLIREAAPEIKILVYFHAFYNSPEEDPEKFKDSWITRADGTRASMPWGALRPSYMVLPTLNNSYGKAALKLADKLMDYFDVDGIYWDEVCCFRPRITHNIWDGHTVEIDPQTFTITRELGLVDLLSRDWKVAFLDRIKSRGGVVVGNTAPSTATLRNIHFPRFTETQLWVGNTLRTHLFSPLAFTGLPTMETIRERLKFGTVALRTALGYASPALRHFFPLTPIELHEGWIKGKERIITSVDGTFGWEGKYEARVLYFDSQGKIVSISQYKTFEGEVIKVEVPEGGIVIIERAF